MPDALCSFPITMGGHHHQSCVCVRHYSSWGFWEGLSLTLRGLHALLISLLNAWRETSTGLWNSLSVQLPSMAYCPVNSRRLGLSGFLALSSQLGESPELSSSMLWTGNLLQGNISRPYLTFSPCLSGIPSFAADLHCTENHHFVYFFCYVCSWFQVVV